MERTGRCIVLLARTPPAAGIYQKVTWLILRNRLLLNRQPECGGRIAIGALRPFVSVVRELAFLSLVKHPLSRLEESLTRQLPFRSCRFSFRRTDRCAHSKLAKSKKMKLPKHLQHINPYAAGIDVGCRSHFVAVPEGSCEQPVREFSSFTDDLHQMADWLLGCGVTSVVMESTGIYWIPGL